MAKGFLRSLLSPGKDAKAAPKPASRADPAAAGVAPAEAPPAAPASEAPEVQATPPEPAPAQGIWPMTPERRKLFDELMSQRAKILANIPKSSRRRLTALVEAQLGIRTQDRDGD